MAPRLPPAARALAALLIVVAAGCGDDGAETAAPTDADLVVEARDLDFDADAYAVAAGEIDVAYVQRGRSPHDLKVEPGGGLHLEVQGDRELDRGTVTLEPGTYTLYCSLAGHRAAGMEATLTVR